MPPWGIHVCKGDEPLPQSPSFSFPFIFLFPPCILPYSDTPNPSSLPSRLPETYFGFYLVVSFSALLVKENSLFELGYVRTLNRSICCRCVHRGTLRTNTWPNSRNLSKPAFNALATVRLETAPSAMNHHVGKWSKTTVPTLLIFVICETRRRGN